MLRVFDHYVPTRTVLQLGTDLVLLLTAAMLAGSSVALLYGAPQDPLGLLLMLLAPSLTFAATMLLLFMAFGAYRRDRVCSLRTLLLCALLSAFVSVGPLWFLMEHIFYPQHNALRFLGLAYLYEFALLLLARQAMIGAWAARLWNRRVLVVGCGGDAAAVAGDLERHGGGGYELVGFYPSGHDETFAAPPPGPVFDTRETLSAMALQHGVDEIVVAVRDQRGGVLPLRHLLECRTQGIPVYSLAAFSERMKGEVPLDSLKASWLIYGNGFAQGWLRTTIKRSFDIVASLILLSLSWWIMLLAALAIVAEDGAPVLFRQERVGRHGRSFQVLKFRSMRKDAEKDGVARWAQANDSRITRVGRFIRKTRIDELPQLFNVLRGEMSLVGPRPERPGFVEQLTEQIPFYAIRHSVKPGLTGWAQVRFSYGASLADARRKLQFDLYYVKNHSLLLDLQVLLETVRVVLFGEGAR